MRHGTLIVPLSETYTMEKREEKSATGNKQSAFAGTNPDVYGDQRPIDDQDNPITDNEAQNVTDGERPLEGDELTHERNKANQGDR